MKKLLVLMMLVGCETLDSVQSEIYSGMTKSKFCESTGLVMVSEDPCFGKSFKLTEVSNVEIITNQIESKYYIFKNKRLVGTASTYSGAYIQAKKLTGNTNSQRPKVAQSTISKPSTPKVVTNSKPSKSYSSSASTKKLSTYSQTYKNNYACNSAKSELDNAERKLRQANNYFNINSISCNNSGRSCMVMPQQCQNTSYQCQNRSYSCRSGDYACTSRESNRYNQCRSNANNQYNQCQQRARQAAENQRRNCENQKARGRTQCIARVKNEQKMLISQASILQSDAKRKIANSCE